MEEVLQFGLERLTQRRRAQLSAPQNEREREGESG